MLYIHDVGSVIPGVIGVLRANSILIMTPKDDVPVDPERVID